MERRSFLNGRFSLSTSNLSGTPVAESTHISHLQPKFPWGDGPLNSSSEKYIPNDLVKKTTVISKAGLRQKNDPRTYTDIQSKGLTSRIVKYHGNNTRLNSSLSMNNLYNKPGQFPVVHLKKQKEICNFNKKNLSMVRIAPPEKTVFQANTRSSILRTGSIVATIGFHKSGDEVSRENRPILHPAVENEIAPTRSVLDDLKEISRKRINSDVLDSNDSLKKYCKELEVSTAASPTLQQTSAPPLYANVPSKRQREIPLSTAGTQKSPEQHGIKRRMYSNVNNDITSSLSSSLNILSPKLKCPVTVTKTPVAELLLSSQNTQTINSTNSAKSNNSLGQYAPVRSEKEIFRNEETFRSISEPMLSTQTNNKPKLTLFNKNYETSIPKEHIHKNNSKEGFTSICFVKPKPNTLDSNNIGLSENSLIARTQKSKLALMLSGLSGDLNLNDEDEIDTGSKFNRKTDSVSSSQADSNDAQTILNSSQTTLSFGTSTTVATKIISSPTTANSNGDEVVEKSVLPVKSNQFVLNKENSSIITTTSIPVTNSLKNISEVTTVAVSFPNKKGIELNSNISGIDSLSKLPTNFTTINNISSSTTTTSLKNIFGSETKLAIPNIILNNPLTKTVSDGRKENISSTTKVPEINHTLSNNFLPQNDLSQQEQQQNVTLSNNSSNMFNNDPNKIFGNIIKTSSYLPTKTFNFNNANVSSNTFNSTFGTKPTESNMELTGIVSQNALTNKISDTINLFPIMPLQQKTTILDNASKNEKVDTFTSVNNNIISKENTFTNFLPTNTLGQNFATFKATDVKNNVANKILPIQSGNQFLPTSTNMNVSTFSFKPVATISQPNEQKNNFVQSTTNNIPNMFSFGSNTKEVALPPMGTTTTNQFSFGAVNNGINNNFSFDEKKTFVPHQNIADSNKIDLNKSSTFTFGNKVATSNQFGTNCNTEVFSPFSFRENESQNINSPLNNTAVNNKTFSFSANLNTQKEASFNFSGSCDQNLSNKSEITANQTIPNLFTPVSSSVSNERLIRKATRRLHK